MKEGTKSSKEEEGGRVEDKKVVGGEGGMGSIKKKGR